MKLSKGKKYLMHLLSSTRFFRLFLSLYLCNFLSRKLSDVLMCIYIHNVDMEVGEMGQGYSLPQNALV